ncbi:hypothetical protein ACHAWX_002459 [Stephanocyclus meneghinianus]
MSAYNLYSLDDLSCVRIILPAVVTSRIPRKSIDHPQPRGGYFVRQTQSLQRVRGQDDVFRVFFSGGFRRSGSEGGAAGYGSRDGDEDGRSGSFGEEFPVIAVGAAVVLYAGGVVVE